MYDFPIEDRFPTTIEAIFSYHRKQESIPKLLLFWIQQLLKSKSFTNTINISEISILDSYINHYIHNNWLETFTIMCNDIEKLEFDIALLGCGGYGLPLCNFIKTKMNKSSIYIGGGLQLLFGVMGHRWINRDDWKKIIKENNTNFVFPSENEKLDNKNTIENSAYW